MDIASSKPAIPETTDLPVGVETRRTFFTIASELAMLNADVAAKLAAEADTQQILPAHLALRQGLLSPSQVDIIETLLRPGDAVPGYEIMGLLGKGGMGVVYRARQKSLDRVVALKTVLVSQLADPSAVQRFEQEAQAVARLMHPHIIAAYDFGRHQGRLFFAMELVEGEDVEKLATRVGPLDEALAWGLLRQAAAGLAHAAKGGVVHRDIKPANLLLVQPPEGFPLPAGMPLVKIADFGLAFLSSEEGSLERTRLTMASTTMGSPHYMAPEQLDGGNIDLRTDIYALGATAWQMLAGQPPLHGKTLSQIMSAKLTGEIESVRTLNPRVSEASSALVSQMLRRDPQQRPVSYEELLRKIDSLAKRDAPVHAGETAAMPIADFKSQETRLPEQPTSPPPLPKPVPRKLPRWLLPGGAGAAALVLILLAVVNFFTRQPLPVARELVNIGKSVSLFNGENLRGWKNLSGTWIPGKDDEGGRVVIGSDGVTARKLPALLGAAEPPKFYQIEFGFSFQKAEAMELHFDLANYQEHRCILRMTRAGSVLGYCDGDRGSFVPGRTTRPPRPFAKDVDDVHSVKLERQPGGWIASVDGVDIGTLPLYHQRPESEFRLRVEKGPAWLENFVLEELTTK
ncbi:MAG: protein kinase domain-containing protein [Pirellulaceae bacterium]